MVKSTDPAISCPTVAAAGKVCSHAVTTKMLLDWGIEVEIRLDHLHVPGPAFHKAAHTAWQKGFVVLCTLDPATVRGRRTH